MQQDEHEAAPDHPEQPEQSGDRAGDWVRASGVHAEHVLGEEAAPRIHRALMILGPLGLAVGILASLWSMSRHVQRSVNVQVETQWVAGEQLAVRTQLVGPDLAPLELPKGGEVSLRYLDTAGQVHELGALSSIGAGLSQGSLTVPTLEPETGQLELHYDLGPAHRVEPFSERVPVEIVEARAAEDGRQVVSEHMLQWADDTDEQPEGVRIDLRPAGRLLAGFNNRLFLRVTDPAGRPWLHEGAAPEVEVRLVSGEFDERAGELDNPPLLYSGKLDSLGLADFAGTLRSDVVRFEVRLPNEAKRTLRFVSHAGTVRVEASTDFAHPGEEVQIAVEAISARKPVFVDLHGPAGAWIETVTPPLRVPQERAWTVPANMVDTVSASGGELAPFAQFEAYQSTLRPEDTSAIARVQIAPSGTPREAALPPLIERQRQQLSLPRVDRNFEIGRERKYLSEIEQKLKDKALGPEEIDRARAFLIGSLEAVVHGPPQSLNTRAREDEVMGGFKSRWTIGIRWFLLGGGGLYILLMAMLVWRNQKAFEQRTSKALSLAEGEGEGEELAELLADSRRQMLGRGVLTIALMVAALLLSVAMLEALVWV